MQVIMSLISLAAMVFLGLILSTLFGAAAGWVVDLVFPVVNVTLNTLLKTTLTPFELGAVMGFVGGFFRSSHTCKK